MYFMGFTFNTLTLLSIGLSVGVLVTNSIVVLEAISKRLDETGDPVASSRLGAKETFIAVLQRGTNVVDLFPLSVWEVRSCF
jgi:HAE1 family hydrophobic/amphiphilic exporter-1